MTDKDVLTQEEIDALLAGVDDGSLDTEEASEGDRVATWDLTNQDRVVRGRLPAVELISERFARTIRATLPQSLKIPLEVGTGGVQVMKFSEYTETLFVPTCIKLLRIQPFAGTCMLALDAKLVHRIVDRFFGGDGTASAVEGREFSPTENRVVARIVDRLLRDFKEAWQEVLEVDCAVVGDEINPGLVNAIPSSDAVLVTSYRLDLDEGGGELHLVFPYASLEPYKRLLDTSSQHDTEDFDQAWRQRMEETLLDTEVPLNCLIGDSQIRLRDLMRLEVGDVLDLQMQEIHQVRVGKLPLFTATLGDSRGRFALEFQSFGRE